MQTTPHRGARIFLPADFEYITNSSLNRITLENKPMNQRHSINTSLRHRQFVSATPVRVAVCCVFSVLAASAAAQSFPSKPVRMIVPLAAGGSTDVLARLIGTKLTERAVLPPGSKLDLNDPYRDRTSARRARIVLFGTLAILLIVAAWLAKVWPFSS
jgi:hypothetical protein